MKKVLFILVLAMAICSSCILSEKPSICDNLQQPSVLCDMANENGFRLEMMGTLLIVANAVAIGEEVYTVQEAINVLSTLKSSLDKDITYLLFRGALKKYMNKYPGMFIVANMYLDEFTSPEIIYPYDKALLKSWLNKRILELEALK